MTPKLNLKCSTGSCTHGVHSGVTISLDTTERFRSIELLKPGTPVHACIYTSLPLDPSPSAERLLECLYKLGKVLSPPAARAYKKAILNAGFGPIYHAKRLRHGLAGAVSYIGKYLAKSTAKSLFRPDRCRIWTAESSRDRPSLRRLSSCLIGNIQCDHHVPPREWHYECRNTDTPQDKHYNERLVAWVAVSAIILGAVLLKALVDSNAKVYRRPYCGVGIKKHAAHCRWCGHPISWGGV